MGGRGGGEGLYFGTLELLVLCVSYSWTSIGWSSAGCSWLASKPFNIFGSAHLHVFLRTVRPLPIKPSLALRARFERDTRAMVEG